MITISHIFDNIASYRSVKNDHVVRLACLINDLYLIALIIKAYFLLRGMSVSQSLDSWLIKNETVYIQGHGHLPGRRGDGFFKKIVIKKSSVLFWKRLDFNSKSDSDKSSY
jgi:hypothetical protein